ncbi:PREDICTED: RUN domain-containing protein 1-like isoform X2 [Branchiostoma belcheri]|uniref:RUN domain-containing protein 1 n=1 Tax=Branchiostoma belcheri TaxID=7741 RepID=A0A6P4ZQ48_BRABE|nr:PREDICTED: RUN domain-containing protein 1-like isoform X2 [Branchiostoma belcheri]
MMEEVSNESDFDLEMEGLSLENQPDVERWPPVGATASPTPGAQGGGDQPHVSEIERLRMLEQEQDQLNSSLLALTTHFAQVQFRLKQIVTAPPDDKEGLLKELEEFAFQGCPDVRGCVTQDAQILDDMSEREHEFRILEQREKQQELIKQLKNQLEDLEDFAYKEGAIDMPTAVMQEKQRVIIDQLTSKMDLDIDGLDKLTTEELRHRVDNAVGEIVNPAKVKEQVIHQLKTQITDLEMFIEFLQENGGDIGHEKEGCTCPVHGETRKGNAPPQIKGKVTGGSPEISKQTSQARLRATTQEAQKKIRETSLSIMKRALTVLQIFAVSQFGCGANLFKDHIIPTEDRNSEYNFDELLKALDQAVSHVCELAKVRNDVPDDSDYLSDSSESPVRGRDELTNIVRRELAPALRDVFQHGLMKVGQSKSLSQAVMPYFCFQQRKPPPPGKMHAWELLVKYYEMKHGREYNLSPARKLSESFSLDIVGGTAITAKQTLLSAIHDIVSTHDPLKRSMDSEWKAWVCCALNQGRIVSWCRLVVRTAPLITSYYQPWGFTAKTSFDPALQILNRLTEFKFHIPTDLAIRHFQNIKDAFGEGV